MKRVWIFGAGASVDLGFPIGGQMLAEIKNFIEQNKSWLGNQGISKEDRELIGSISQLWNSCDNSIKRLYGEKSLDQIDFEDYFTQLAVLKEEFIPLMDNQAVVIGKEMTEFTRLYYWFLHARLNQMGNVQSFEEKKKSLLKFCSFINPQTDILVSFNQDTVFESFIWTDFKPSNGIVVPYSYNPTEIHDNRFLSIIKPHGSMNWVYATKEQAEKNKYRVLITIPEKYQVEKNLICEIPWLMKVKVNDDPIIPYFHVMMPPYMFKGIVSQNYVYSPFEGMLFRDLYRNAFKSIKEAEKVIIVGFSARPTDYLAQTFLKYSLGEKRSNDVLVIDPASDIPEGLVKSIGFKPRHEQKGFLSWLADDGHLKIQNGESNK